MQKGQHIGKILVKMPQRHEALLSTPARRKHIFPADGTYLLVGGLGNLGKLIASWMVEHGAKNFVFLGRSAGQTRDDQGFMEELDLLGCKSLAVVGDVTKLEDVKRAINSAPSKIRGVFQLSLELRVSPHIVLYSCY